MPFFNDVNRGWPPETESTGPQLPPNGYRAGLLIRSHAARTYTHQELLLPPLPWPSPLRLSVSFILFNCQRYVSGFCLSYSTGSNGSRSVLEKAGVLIPETEEHLDLGQDSIPHAITIYSTMDGIIGLEFFRDEHVANKSILLGYSSVKLGDVATAKLYPRTPSMFKGLSLAFDVWINIHQPRRVS